MHCSGDGCGGYERLRSPISHLHFQIEPPASPVALLRQLGAPPSWKLQETPAEVLAPLYTAAAAFARELALRPTEELERPPTSASPLRPACR